LSTIAFIFIASNSQVQTAVCLNPEASIDERVDDLLSRMTVYEKIGQMTQLNISVINNTDAASDVVLNEE
jgi:beta-glucosidase